MVRLVGNSRLSFLRELALQSGANILGRESESPFADIVSIRISSSNNIKPLRYSTGSFILVPSGRWSVTAVAYSFLLQLHESSY